MSEQKITQENSVKGSEVSGTSTRRRWLQVTGGAAIALPVLGLTACSDGGAGSTSPAAKPADDAKDAAKSMSKDASDGAKSMVGDAKDSAGAMSDEMTDDAKGMAKDMTSDAEQMGADAAAKPGEMMGKTDLVKIEVSDPVAKALSYTPDATQVDKSKHPRYEAGHNCSNCAQYKAQGSDGWGSCAIFPGKLVSAKAWCSGYIAVS